MCGFCVACTPHKKSMCQNFVCELTVFMVHLLTTAQEIEDVLAWSGAC